MLLFCYLRKSKYFIFIYAPACRQAIISLVISKSYFNSTFSISLIMELLRVDGL